MGFHHVPTVCGCQFPGILPVVASLPSGGTRSDGRVMLRLQPSCKSVKSGGTTLQIYINSWISASFLPIKRCILVAFRDFCFFEESKCFVCRCGPSRFITSFFIMESRVESLLSRQVVPVFCRQGLFGDSFQNVFVQPKDQRELAHFGLARKRRMKIQPLRCAFACQCVAGVCPAVRGACPHVFVVKAPEGPLRLRVVCSFSDECFRVVL